MHTFGGLHKSTRASARFHKCLIVFLVGLIALSSVLIVFCSNNNQSLTATTVPDSEQGSSADNQGSYIFHTENLLVTPEYSLGGGLIALCACFIAFGVFAKRKMFQ
jgi:hypothetical protein